MASSSSRSRSQQPPTQRRPSSPFNGLARLPPHSRRAASPSASDLPSMYPVDGGISGISSSFSSSFSTPSSRHPSHSRAASSSASVLPFSAGVEAHASPETRSTPRRSPTTTPPLPPTTPPYINTDIRFARLFSTSLGSPFATTADTRAPGPSNATASSSTSHPDYGRHQRTHPDMPEIVVAEPEEVEGEERRPNEHQDEHERDHERAPSPTESADYSIIDFDADSMDSNPYIPGGYPTGNTSRYHRRRQQQQYHHSHSRMMSSLSFSRNRPAHGSTGGHSSSPGMFHRGGHGSSGGGGRGGQSQPQATHGLASSPSTASSSSSSSSSSDSASPTSPQTALKSLLPRIWDVLSAPGRSLLNLGNTTTPSSSVSGPGASSRTVSPNVAGASASPSSPRPITATTSSPPPRTPNLSSQVKPQTQIRSSSSTHLNHTTNNGRHSPIFWPTSSISTGWGNGGTGGVSSSKSKGKSRASTGISTSYGTNTARYGWNGWNAMSHGGRGAMELPDDINYLELAPLDGEEGELIDEACFIDCPSPSSRYTPQYHHTSGITTTAHVVPTRIDILANLPTEVALHVLMFLGATTTSSTAFNSSSEASHSTSSSSARSHTHGHRSSPSSSSTSNSFTSAATATGHTVQQQQHAGTGPGLLGIGTPALQASSATAPNNNAGPSGTTGTIPDTSSGHLMSTTTTTRMPSPLQDPESDAAIALKTLLACRLVSKAWCRLASDNAVWKELFLHRWVVDLKRTPGGTKKGMGGVGSKKAKYVLGRTWDVDYFEPRFGYNRGRTAGSSTRTYSTVSSKPPVRSAPLQLDWRVLYHERLMLDLRWCGAINEGTANMPAIPSGPVNSRHGHDGSDWVGRAISATTSAMTLTSQNQFARSREQAREREIGTQAGGGGRFSRVPPPTATPWEPRVTKLGGHSDSVYCLEFDSRRIITGSRDRSIKVWSLKTGRLLGSFFGAHRGSVLCLKFSQDWDRDWHDEDDGEDGEVEDSTLSDRDGDLHMAAGDSTTGFAPGSPPSTSTPPPPPPMAGPSSLGRFKPGFMVSGSSDCSVCVWDLSLGHSLDGNDDDDERQVHGEVRAVLKGHTGGVLDLKIDEKWIVSCSKDAVIRVWKRRDLSQHRVLRGHEGPVNAVGLQDGKVVSASGDGKMILWDIQSGERLRTFEGHNRGLACIEFKDNIIVSGSNDCKIKVWNAVTGECLRILTAHDALVRALAFDPRNGRLVSASYDKSVKVWDLASGKLIRDFQKVHGSHIFDVKFDLSRIVSTSHDQKIVILDFSTDMDANLFV